VDGAHAAIAALARLDDEIGQRVVRLVDRVAMQSISPCTAQWPRRSFFRMSEESPRRRNVCSASCSCPMSHEVGAGSAPYFDAVNASASSASRCLAMGAGRGGGFVRALARRKSLHVGKRLREIERNGRGGWRLRRLGAGELAVTGATCGAGSAAALLRAASTSFFKSSSFAMDSDRFSRVSPGTPRHRAPPCTRCLPT
jgi:hypothetical protein